MVFSPTLFILAISCLGLMVGSFLNVVIARLPRMLYEFQALPEKSVYNLAFPASHCPHCLHSIHPIDNLPILSYLLLRGQCRHCHIKISPQYLLTEILSMILSGIIAFHFGMTLETLFALLFTWFLIPLTMIDCKHCILPDQLTLSGIWIGLCASLFSVFQTPYDAILGAVLGYLSLYTVYWIFKFLTGKEGLGYGDFKLLAMCGAFCGWQLLPFILLLASLLGSIFGLISIFYFKRNKNTPMPFGPYLCFAGLIALLYGDQVMHLYLFLDYI
jgi:leader peptidase (prepilin peptidase) / N-methyltransferase